MQPADMMHMNYTIDKIADALKGIEGYMKIEMWLGLVMVSIIAGGVYIVYNALNEE